MQEQAYHKVLPFVPCEGLETREAQPPDFQRRAVYRWEADVLADLDCEPWLGLGRLCGDWPSTRKIAHDAAAAYVTRLWTRYAPELELPVAEVPRVRLSFRRGRGHAHARQLSHEVYCHIYALTRSSLIHETAHLLMWEHPAHGPRFCALLVRMWGAEFGIARDHALALAAEQFVRVAADEDTP
jgi:hypothetical protein